MKAVTQMFIGTTDEWESVNPRLYDAVWGIEERTDGGRLLKIGNGKDLWNDLGYVDENYIQGLPGHFNAEEAARESGDQALQNLITVLSARIDGVEGKGGYLEPHDFGTAAPSQEALTNYALEQIGITDPSAILNGTRVKNTYNDNVWMIVNAPPNFEWVNDGFETVGQATDATLGVVKGSGEDDKASINAAGEIIPHGYLLKRMADGSDNTESARTFTADPGNPLKMEDYVLDMTDHVGTRSLATKTGRYYTKGRADASFGPDDEYAAVRDIKAAQDPAGTIKYTFVRDQFILTQKRLLPLRGDVLPITDYEELVENTYVGDALNATAECFYKTADAEGTLRDVDGTYFVLPDLQGLFVRSAGQNSKHNMANNTPYNGGEIGQFKEDMFQMHWRNSLFVDSTGLEWKDSFGSGTLSAIGLSGNPDRFHMNGVLSDGTNGPPRHGPETRPTSISAYLCITY
jgi:hypothetical protein